MTTSFQFGRGPGSTPFSVTPQSDTKTATIVLQAPPCGTGAIVLEVEESEVARFALALLLALTPIEGRVHDDGRTRFISGHQVTPHLRGAALTPLGEDSSAFLLNESVAALSAYSHGVTLAENAAGAELDEIAVDLARAHSGNEELSLLDLDENEVECWRDVARYTQKLPDALKV